MSVLQTQWIFTALGWTLGAFGLGLGLWALFWDRSRGRRRCPKCWYLMEGVPEQEDGGFICPECGKRIVKEKRFLKTRRRWRWVVVACVVWVVGYGVYLTPQVRRNGWASAVPTAVLVRVVPVDKYVNKKTYKSGRPGTSITEKMGDAMAEELYLRERVLPRIPPFKNMLSKRSSAVLAHRMERWWSTNRRDNDTVIVSYDVENLISENWQRSDIRFSAQEKRDLLDSLLYFLMNFVYTYDWIEAGGDRSVVLIESSNLTVAAPSKVHTSLQDVIELLDAPALGIKRLIPLSGRFDESTGDSLLGVYEIGGIVPTGFARAYPEPRDDGVVDSCEPDGDLYMIGAGEVEDLLTTLMTDIEPEMWVANGGDAAALQTFPGRLVILGQQPLHEQVDDFLNSLRNHDTPSDD